MKPSRAVVLLVATGVAVSAWAKSPKVPRIVCPAQFVYVRTIDGDVTLPRVIPEDRDAAYRLEDRLSEWARYILVYEPQQADLVFVVRTGRIATAQGRVGEGAGAPDQSPNAGPPGANRRDPSDASQGPDDPSQDPGARRANGSSKWVGAGGGVGPPNDLLAIYTKPGDVDKQSPIWQQSLKDGLADPQMALFQQIRSAVDETCRDQGKK